MNSFTGNVIKNSLLLSASLLCALLFFFLPNSVHAENSNLQPVYFPTYAVAPSLEPGIDAKSLLSATSVTCDTCTVKQNLNVTGSLTASSLNVNNVNITGSLTVSGFVPSTAGTYGLTNFATEKFIANKDYVDTESDQGMDVGPDGFARMIYQTGSTGDIHLVRCLDLDCENFVDTVAATDADYSDVPSMRVGSDGFARIVYINYATIGEVHYVRCLNLNCSSKNNTIISNLAAGSNDSLWASNLDLDPTDLATIVFDQYGGAGSKKLMLAQCTNADCSTKNLTTVTSGGGYYEMLDVALGSDNLPRILYSDTGAESLYFVNCANASCSSSTSQLVEANRGYYVSLVLDSNNLARLFYSANNSGYVYKQCTNASCSTSNSTVISTNSSRDQVVIAMGSDGLVRLAYKENQNVSITYYKCLNDSCSSRVGGIVDSFGLYPLSMALGADDKGRLFYVREGSVRKHYYIRIRDESINYASGASIGGSGNVFNNIYTQKVYVAQNISSLSTDISINASGQGNVGIGTTSAPTQQLEISKNFSFALASFYNSSGGYTFQNGSRLFHTYTCYGTFTGTYVGPGAGNPDSCGNADDNMTALGVNALGLLGGSIHDVAIGSNSYSGAGGFQNTAIGAEAFKNGNGYTEVVIGSRAMGGAGPTNTGGVAIGAYALFNANGGATGNVYVGGNDESSSVNSTGAYNTYVGFRSGYTLTPANKNLTGGNNTFLGAQSGPASTTQLTRAVAIGYNALAGASNAFILGGTGVDAVNVGINTTTPDTNTQLHVVGDQRIDGGLCIRNATSCPAFSAGRLYVDTAGTVSDDPGDVFDIAEVFAADSVSPGEVVVASPEKIKRITDYGEIELPKVDRSNTGYQSVLGVVSTRAAMSFFGQYVVTGPESQKENADTAQVALAGRVPVKVTNENGSIEIGDYLTTSKTKPGYAMKATRSGQVIGQALEASSGSTVLVFIKPGYQIINNTFVLEPKDETVLNGKNNAWIVNTASNDILELQNSDTKVLSVANTGELGIFARTNTPEKLVLAINNNGSNLLTLSHNKLSVKTNSIQLPKDTAGTAEVRAGDNVVKVTFSGSYVTTPKITATPIGEPVTFAITNKTAQGFTIKLGEPAVSDIHFDWFAFSVNQSPLPEFAYEDFEKKTSTKKELDIQEEKPKTKIPIQVEEEIKQENPISVTPENATLEYWNEYFRNKYGSPKTPPEQKDSSKKQLSVIRN